MLHNTGSVNGSGWLNAAQTAYQDKTRNKPGNQALKQNEAVLFKYKGSAYLSVNNSKNGIFLARQDLFVNLSSLILEAGDNKAGVLSANIYFT